MGLPIGNGRIGAVVLSEIGKETWSFNEITFWSGQSEPSPKVYGGKDAIKEIQARYLANDFVGGKLLAEQYLQPPKKNYGTNLAVAKIHLEFDQPSATPSSFRRELNLDEAIASAQYALDGHNYRRETFIAHRQQVLVSQISTNSNQGISLSLTISSENPGFIVTSIGDTLEFQAHALESSHSDGKCGGTRSWDCQSQRARGINTSQQWQVDREERQVYHYFLGVQHRFQAEQQRLDVTSFGTAQRYRVTNLPTAQNRSHERPPESVPSSQHQSW